VNLAEIKASVEGGHTVHWASKAYRVIKDNLGQWFIKCDMNAYCIGLTWRDGPSKSLRDGVTMNGREEQFFLSDKGGAE
jgi:hypothetical protein